MQIPCSNELRLKSNMPLALIVQPFALPHPPEEPIQVKKTFPFMSILSPFFLLDIFLFFISSMVRKQEFGSLDQTMSVNQSF